MAQALLTLLQAARRQEVSASSSAMPESRPATSRPGSSRISWAAARPALARSAAPSRAPADRQAVREPRTRPLPAVSRARLRDRWHSRRPARGGRPLGDDRGHARAAALEATRATTPGLSRLASSTPPPRPTGRTARPTGRLQARPGNRRAPSRSRLPARSDPRSPSARLGQPRRCAAARAPVVRRSEGGAARSGKEQVGRPSAHYRPRPPERRTRRIPISRGRRSPRAGPGTFG